MFPSWHGSPAWPTFLSLSASSLLPAVSVRGPTKGRAMHAPRRDPLLIHQKARLSTVGPPNAFSTQVRCCACWGVRCSKLKQRWKGRTHTPLFVLRPKDLNMKLIFDPRSLPYFSPSVSSRPPSQTRDRVAFDCADLSAECSRGGPIVSVMGRTAWRMGER